MGKSNKKAKSDRINALRKQYDAFLEEDKKRKERNDFILGRLDKMRYSTALVPVRCKPNAFEPRPAVVDPLGYQPEFSSIRAFQSPITNQSQVSPDVPVKNNEDTYVIQEISKKYILIPRLSTTFMNNCLRNETINQNTERLQEMHLDQDTVPTKDMKPNTNDNTDWKSKYEILNILKNEEKGKQSGNYDTGFVDDIHSAHKESYVGNNQDQGTINYDNYVNTDVNSTAKEYVNDFPERDLTTDTLHYELPKDSEYSLNNTVSTSSNLVANADTSSENNKKNVANVDQTDAIGDQLQNITLEYKHSDAPNIDISRQVTDYYEPQPELDDNITSTIADVSSKQSVHIDEENVKVQDEYPIEVDSLLNGHNVSVEQYVPADSEKVVYVDDSEISPMQDLNYNSPSTPDENDHIFEEEHLAEVSNVQEFAPNIGVQMKTDNIVIPEEKIHQNSNIDTIEQTELVNEQIENPANVTESIEDFDAEQREMFYSEPTDENYTNQHGDVMNPLDVSQTEYPQNQEYAYYENTEAESYPVGLNDEEMTQQYDPNYEQQYAGLDQGLEQQQYDQYQEPERGTDQIDPGFEMQYEQQFESQSKIEEALDVEDDYTAQKHEASDLDMPPDVEAIETDKSDGKTVLASEQNMI